VTLCPNHPNAYQPKFETSSFADKVPNQLVHLDGTQNQKKAHLPETTLVP
jgi:hypothetical protein